MSTHTCKRLSYDKMADALRSLITRLEEYNRIHDHGVYQVVLKHRIAEGCTWERSPQVEGDVCGGALLYKPDTLFVTISFRDNGKHKIEFESTHLEVPDEALDEDFSLPDDFDDFVLVSEAEANRHHKYDPHGSLIVYKEYFKTVPTLAGLKQKILEVGKVYTLYGLKEVNIDMRKDAASTIQRHYRARLVKRNNAARVIQERVMSYLYRPGGPFYKQSEVNFYTLC